VSSPTRDRGASGFASFVLVVAWLAIWLNAGRPVQRAGAPGWLYTAGAYLLLLVLVVWPFAWQRRRSIGAWLLIVVVDLALVLLLAWLLTPALPNALPSGWGLIGWFALFLVWTYARARYLLRRG
jgi:hypothetical protein